MSARARRPLEWPPLVGHVVALAALATLAAWLLLLQGRMPEWQAPDALRGTLAAVAVLAWLVACARAGYRHARESRRAGSSTSIADAALADSPRMLVAHASQTGQAVQLAQRTADALRDAGVVVDLMRLAALDPARLRAAGRVLIVASTTGEGDAPDDAVAFVRNALGEPADLRGLRYGLLALGDRSYRNFCGFGRQLDAWLRHGAAEPLFDPVEVDDGDEGALRHWQHHLGLLAGSADLADWSAPEYAPWRLRARRLLNAGSVGGPCFHLELEPIDGARHDWQAGDIAEVGPCHAEATVEAWLGALGLDPRDEGKAALRERAAGSVLPSVEGLRGEDARAIASRLRPLPHREYSIASIPDDGAIQLLVRSMQRPDGSIGLGSGWLTQHAQEGASVRLRVRGNPNFHAPRDVRPLLLVGNGTGIAGLRALLRQRIADGHRRNWLVFGERHAAHDFHYRDEILRWQREGWIERLDLAFSRDQAGRVYVQQRLAEAAPALRAWVDAGASVHVCGSLEGMAPGVHAVLVDVLGPARVDRLQDEGRYRRDVY
ncbi:MAG: sulfite reductase flavoprotein subunit alpha [Lysobacteraceae bacterium]|nr:MAG: sulfite reductase flavoprotein subunit alpha [Xanthomonadaceae bacterium]